MAREHRLYQVDWLKRIYRFSNDELGVAFDNRGFLSLDHDPKTLIALEQADRSPLDVNFAGHDELLRVPGVGPIAAQRILENRRRRSIDSWRDLQAMGLVRKRAWPFLGLPGHRPPTGKQLRLDLFGEQTRSREQGSPVRANGLQAPTAEQGLAPCGEARSCVGCSMYGAPGHPGPNA